MLVIDVPKSLNYIVLLLYKGLYICFIIKMTDRSIKFIIWANKIITFMMKVEESEKAVEQMIKTQRIIENNAEHETNSEITIIDNIFV